MTYTIQRNGQQFGPYDGTLVAQYLAQGNFLPTDQAWCAEQQRWMVLAELLPPPVYPRPPILQPVKAKRSFTAKVFLFVFECIAFVIVVGIIRLIPWGSLFATQGATNVAPSGGSLKEAIAGKWEAENGTMKGGTLLFTASGATTWIIPTDAFGLTDCTLTGTYSLVKYKGSEGHPAGNYIRSTLSSKSGNCKDNFQKLPIDDAEKIDVVDENHLLFDTASLVRVN